MASSTCKSCKASYDPSAGKDGECPACLKKGADASASPAALSEADLKKALDQVEVLSRSATPEARKAHLFGKATTAEGLTGDESGELAALLKGEKPASGPLAGGPATGSDVLVKAMAPAAEGPLQIPSRSVEKISAMLTRSCPRGTFVSASTTRVRSTGW